MGRAVCFPFPGERAFPKQCTIAQLQRANRLLQGSLKGTVNRHYFAGSFHLCSYLPVAVGKLVEGPAGNLDHAVIQSRLESGAGFAGNCVGNLVQTLTHRNLGGYPGNRITGSLAGQGGTAADPRIDLNDVIGRIRLPLGLNRLCNVGMRAQG